MQIFAPAKRDERDLVQIVYVSSAAPSLTPAHLDAMAARSGDRHDSSRLTGLLLHRGEYFYAILEGPRRHVLQRIEEIIEERGQRELRILREESIGSRRFANWCFGALPASGSDPEGPHEFLQTFCERLG